MKKLKYLWSNYGDCSSTRQRLNTRGYQKATNKLFFLFKMYYSKIYTHDDTHYLIVVVYIISQLTNKWNKSFPIFWIVLHFRQVVPKKEFTKWSRRKFRTYLWCDNARVPNTHVVNKPKVNAGGDQHATPNPHHSSASPK